MTAHDHRSFVDGCYRCDLNRDELEAAGNECEDELDRLRAQRDAVLAIHYDAGGVCPVEEHGYRWPCPTARALGVEA